MSRMMFFSRSPSSCRSKSLLSYHSPRICSQSTSMLSPYNYLVRGIQLIQRSPLNWKSQDQLSPLVLPTKLPPFDSCTALEKGGEHKKLQLEVGRTSVLFFFRFYGKQNQWLFFWWIPNIDVTIRKKGVVEFAIPCTFFRGTCDIRIARELPKIVFFSSSD